jgi:putative tryptophan/tyrosine transport system substrate-binding protein
MKRREFVGLLGGAAAWPLVAHAQQSDRTWRIGVFIARSKNDSEGAKHAAALERGLKELGWIPGQNAQIDYRWQTDDPAQRSSFVNELVALRPDILVVHSTPYLTAVRDATRTIPIVFVAIADPVAQGFVESLARPGGTITGWGVEEPALAAKWAELLKEIAPGVRSVTAIFNPEAAPFSRMFLPSMEAVLQRIGGELIVSSVRDESQTEQAIAVAARRAASGLIFLPDSSLSSHREFIVAAVARHRLPAIYSIAAFAQSGGLIAYGIDRSDLFYRSAAYVDRILKGASPATLPVQMPVKFELAINLKTAKSLGLEVPPTLLARADEVME